MQVGHEPEHDRFTLDHGDAMSVLQYSMTSDTVMHLIRTFVAPAYRGRGHGGELVRAALENARERGYGITSSCWFVDAFIEEHPEYRALEA